MACVRALSFATCDITHRDEIVDVAVHRVLARHFVVQHAIVALDHRDRERALRPVEVRVLKRRALVLMAIDVVELVRTARLHARPPRVELRCGPARLREAFADLRTVGDAELCARVEDGLGEQEEKWEHRRASAGRVCGDPACVVCGPSAAKSCGAFYRFF